MFAKLKAKWLAFWHKHIQKTMAWFAGLPLTAEVVAQFRGAEGPVTNVLGQRWFNLGLLGLIVIVGLRAHMAKQPEVLPPPTVPPMT